MVISIEEYYSDMKHLLSKIDCNFDCIVAIKRSGWILGAYFSNQTGKPVFTYSEIKSIPDKYKNVLIVDDKICKGKALKKVEGKLNSMHKKFCSACMYVEGDIYPNYYSQHIGKIAQMWYEYKIICERI